MTPPTENNSGKQAGKCNRTACSNPHDWWWNTATEAYYCESCKKRISEWSPNLFIKREPVTPENNSRQGAKFKLGESAGNFFVQDSGPSELIWAMCLNKERAQQIIDALNSIEAAHLVVNTWSAQMGRVFESMGDDNPRAIAIDNAINELRALLTRQPK